MNKSPNVGKATKERSALGIITLVAILFAAHMDWFHWLYEGGFFQLIGEWM